MPRSGLRMPLMAGALAALTQCAWPAPEVLLLGRNIAACAYSDDATMVYFSWTRSSGEVRRFSLAPAAAGQPLAGDAAELVTAGINPLPFSGRLLFVRRGSKKGGLWVRDLATGEERQVRRDPFMGLPPTVCADGSVILASRWAGKSQRIGIVDTATGKFGSLPGEDMTQPAVNAAGDRLLYVHQGQVWLRELATGQDTQLTQGELSYSWPTWSRSGDRVAFCAQTTEGACGIGVLALADGSVSWPAQRLEKASCPAFSPDGRSLIFLCATADGFDTLICRVAALPREGVTP